MCGNGEERDKDGDLIYKGQYQNNLRHGHGVLYYDVCMSSFNLN